MHSSGEKFICSGENILHHHTTEVAALPEQTSKYSNENLVRTPNHPVHTFFFFRYPSLLEDILEFQDRMASQEDGAEGEGPRGITGRRGEKKEIKGHVVIMVHLE